MNPYEILEVPMDASQQEIKASYRKLAQKAHPDRDGGSEEKIRLLNEAYYILRNEERRKQYDATGSTNGEISPEHKAYQMFATAVHEQLLGGDFLGNLVQEVIQALNKKYIKISLKLLEAEKQKKQLEKQLGRITSKGEENIYEDVLKSILSQLDDALSSEQKRLEIINLAIELAEQHKDTKPKQPNPELSTPPWGIDATADPYKR